MSRPSICGSISRWKYDFSWGSHEIFPAMRNGESDRGTFAGHKSESVQQTLYAMGEAALAACDGVTEIQLALPNRHHLLVDLAPFGLDNPNEIFVATDEPFGLIQATVRR